jgi:hypothetical protein
MTRQELIKNFTFLFKHFKHEKGSIKVLLFQVHVVLHLCIL